MNLNNQPRYVILSTEEMYEYMNELVIQESEYDFPFTISCFADLVEDIVSTILPTNIINGYNSALEKADIYVGPRCSFDLVKELQRDLIVQVRHLQLPTYAVPGFVYRFYITGDLNLHIHYEHQSPQVGLTLTHTRDDILACIENGDYISERVKRTYGI